MENDNIRENENLNEEVVEEIITSEATEEVIEESIVIEPVETEVEKTEAEEADMVEETDAGEAADELIGDEWQQDEEVYEADPIEPLSEEEIAAIMAAKKKQRKIVISIIAAVVAVVAVVAAWVCSVEGVGSKTFVNTTLSAAENGEDGAKKDNIKFENPIMAVVNNFIEAKEDAAMTINGKAVDRGVFNFVTNAMALNHIGSLMQVGMVTDVTDFDWEETDLISGLSYLEHAKGLAVEELIPVYAFIAEGEKRGIFLSEEEEKEITDGIAELKKQYGDDFEKVLNQNAYPSEEAFREFNRIQRHMNKIYQDAKEDTEKYFDRTELEKNMNDGKITVKHILVMFSEDNTAEVTDEMKDAAKKKAEEVLAKVKAGEDFDKLVEEYNQDPGATSEGYTFANDGTMVQAFADASFALEVGKTSELVEAPYGYHIIKRVERTITVDDYINQLSESCPVRIRRGNFSDIKITINLADYTAQ